MPKKIKILAKLIVLTILITNYYAPTVWAEYKPNLVDNMAEVKMEYITWENKDKDIIDESVGYDYGDTLQLAFQKGQANITGTGYNKNLPEYIADSTGTRSPGQGLEILSGTKVDIVLGDNFTASREIKDITIFQGGFTEPHKFQFTGKCIYEISYSTVSSKDKFSKFVTVDNSGAESGKAQRIKLSGFGRPIKDIWALRIVLKLPQGYFGGVLQEVDINMTEDKELRKDFVRYVENPTEDKTYTATVKNEVANVLSTGIGVNMLTRPEVQWHHMDFYSDKDWGIFYDLLKWQEPSLIRHGGFYSKDFITDDGKFTVETEKMQHYLKMVNYMEERQIPYYFSGWDSKLSWVNGIGEYDIETYTNALVKLVDYMVNTVKAKYFVGLNIKNEPDGSYYQITGWEDKFFETDKILHNKLKAVGLRDKIKLIGGETTTYWAVDSEIKAHNKYKEYYDILSIHEYKSTSEWNITKLPSGKMRNSQLIAGDYKKRLDNQKDNFKDKPIMLGEYGATDKDVLYNDTLSQVEFAMQSINAGISGALYWKYSGGNAVAKDKSLLLDVDGYRIKPNANLFYPVAAFSKYTRLNSNVYKYDYTGGSDQNKIQRVFLNAFKAPDGNVTFKLMNNGFEEKEVVLNVEIPTDKTTFNIISLSENQKEQGLINDGSINLNNGKLSFKIKPRSIVTVTSFELGDVSLPLTVGKLGNDGSKQGMKNDEITVKLNNLKVEFSDQKPVLVNNRTMVPMRAIFEKFGAEVKWDEATRSVTGTKGAMKVNLTIDQAIAFNNGKEVTLDVPAQIIGGRTMVPLRFIGEALGAQVGWDGSTKTVSITTNNDNMPNATPTPVSETSQPGNDNSLSKTFNITGKILLQEDFGKAKTDVSKEGFVNENKLKIWDLRGWRYPKSNINITEDKKLFVTPRNFQEESGILLSKGLEGLNQGYNVDFTVRFENQPYLIIRGNGMMINYAGGWRFVKSDWSDNYIVGDSKMLPNQDNRVRISVKPLNKGAEISVFVNAEDKPVLSYIMDEYDFTRARQFGFNAFGAAKEEKDLVSCTFDDIIISTLK